MKLRTLALGAITASVIAVPAIAEAAWGQATGTVNMRACASTACAKIAVVPAGARVWVGGSQGGWYQVRYGGAQGFVSARFIATAVVTNPRYNYNHQIGMMPPPPPFGYYQKPWWDNRHNAWYDGRRWYRNGIWYNDPSGFSFGFSFGG
jgi:uncharacterized protein YraI